MAQTSAVQGDVYRVTVEGEYYSHRAGIKTVSKYTADFLLDDTAKKLGFLSVIRNKLLARKLKATYPDYKKFRTHNIVNVVNVSKGDTPVPEIALMNRKQLVAYIQRKKFNIHPGLFPDVNDLREAIKMYRDSRETFEKFQKKRVASKGPEITMMQALDELNPDIDKVAFTPEQEASVYGQSHLMATPPPVFQAQPPNPLTAYSGLNWSSADDNAVVYDDGPEPIEPDDGEDVTDVDYIGDSEFDEADELNAMLDGV